MAQQLWSGALRGQFGQWLGTPAEKVRPINPAAVLLHAKAPSTAYALRLLQVLAALADCRDATMSEDVRTELATVLDTPLDEWLARFGKRKAFPKLTQHI
jgi:hypothetical protein